MDRIKLRATEFSRAGSQWRDANYTLTNNDIVSNVKATGGRANPSRNSSAHEEGNLCSNNEGDALSNIQANPSADVQSDEFSYDCPYNCCNWNATGTRDAVPHACNLRQSGNPIHVPSARWMHLEWRALPSAGDLISNNSPRH